MNLLTHSPAVGSFVFSQMLVAGWDSITSARWPYRYSSWAFPWKPRITGLLLFRFSVMAVWSWGSFCKLANSSITNHARFCPSFGSFRRRNTSRSIHRLWSGWKPEEHKNGSVCKTVADASKPEAFLAGVEIAKPLQQAGRFRIPFRKTARQQAVRSSFSVKEEDSACIQTNRYHGCGLAHVSALGRKHAGGDGRTSAHNPRLLAVQQPSCHEQVPAGDIEDQGFGAGQTGRRYFADRYFAEDKPNPMSALWECSRMGPFSFGAYRPLTSPDLL